MIHASWVDDSVIISPYALKRLAEILTRTEEFAAAYLYPVYECRQYVLICIVENMDYCNLFSEVSHYSKDRHHEYVAHFTPEQVRVHEMQSISRGVLRWKQSLCLPQPGQSVIQDALILPPDWQDRIHELQSLYPSSHEPAFLEILASRNPLVVFE